jgi:hypothetical protein
VRMSVATTCPLDPTRSASHCDNEPLPAPISKHRQPAVTPVRDR